MNWGIKVSMRDDSVWFVPFVDENDAKRWVGLVQQSDPNIFSCVVEDSTEYGDGPNMNTNRLFDRFIAVMLVDPS